MAGFDNTPRMLLMVFAGAHIRPIPPTVLLAAGTEVDPD
jgi:hypothetical protein